MREWACLLNVAFPDIEEIQVTENLEFVIMACDGECVCVCVCVCVACTCLQQVYTNKATMVCVLARVLFFSVCIPMCVRTYLCVCAFEEMESFLLNP